MMIRTLLLATLVLVGCDSRSHGVSRIRRIYGNAPVLRDATCDCFDRLGFSSREACVSSPVGMVTDTQLDCLEDVYAANRSALDPVLDCQERATDELIACVTAATDCGAMFDACTTDYSDAAGSCPPIPSSVTAAFSACVEPPRDRDGDGFTDDADLCPDQAEDFDGDMDTDGCPEGEPVDDTYTFCVDTSDCGDLDDQCIQLSIPAAGTFGNFCTHSCSSHFDCESNFGFPGGCYDVESAGNLCYQTCDFDSDCLSSSVCIEITLADGLVDFICVPDN